MSDNLDVDFTKEKKEITVTPKAKKYFVTISGFGIFVAIYGFLITIFMITVALKLFSAASELRKIYGGLSSAPSGNSLDAAISMYNTMGIIVLIIGLLCILPGVFLIRYAANMRGALQTNDQYDFEYAIKYLRNAVVSVAIYAAIMLILIACSYLGLFTPDRPNVLTPF